MMDSTRGASPSGARWVAARFLTLASRGFYDGLRFHRVVPDFDRPR